MAKKKPPAEDPAPSARARSEITVWLTPEILAQLARLQSILGHLPGDARDTSRSAVVRVAIRRLLLDALHNRANPDDPDDPLWQEYELAAQAGIEAGEVLCEPPPAPLRNQAPATPAEPSPKKRGRAKT